MTTEADCECTVLISHTPLRLPLSITVAALKFVAAALRLHNLQLVSQRACSEESLMNYRPTPTPTGDPSPLSSMQPFLSPICTLPLLLALFFSLT